MIGFEFTITTSNHIQSVDEAKALMAQFLHPRAKIAIHSIEYDYLSINNQSQSKPLNSEVKGKVWFVD